MAKAKKRSAKRTTRSAKRQMRRSVMGTMSVLLMLTAVIVALIPVPKAAALSADQFDVYYDGGAKTGFTATFNMNAYLPDRYTTEAFPVYASGDGMLRVAFGSNYGSEVGVIVGYNKANSLNSSSSIIVPDKMPAYRYNSSLQAYVAVDRSNYFLYYEAQPYTSDASPQVFAPCTYDSYDAWSMDDAVLYRAEQKNKSDVLANIENTVSGNAVPTGLTASTQLMIPINYIGNNQSYVIDLDKSAANDSWPDGDYETASESNDGIFQGVTNVNNVQLPDTLYGVGDRAFKGCNALQSVTFGNGLRCIGSEAFWQCRSLSSVTFGTPSNLDQVGDLAFAECSNLPAIAFPKSLTQLGDFCFYDCEKLENANLMGEGEDDGTDSNLQRIGQGLFYNCYGLRQLSLPPNVSLNDVHLTWYGCRGLNSLALPSHATGTLNHDNVTGCYSLNYINCASENLDFECPTQGSSDICDKTDDPTETFGKTNLGVGSPEGEDYEVSDAFVIMAYYDSKAEQYTRRHTALAFGYLDDANAGKYRKYVDGYYYTADDSGHLVGFTRADNSNNGKNVLIPDQIGPYTVNYIDASTFAGNTDIRYLEVPETVSNIAAGAFSGCENLRNVYFENSDGVTIESGAFNTNANAAVINEGGLKFFGAIGGSNPSNAYYYAMNSGTYNNTRVAPADCINFCTAFPENLEIEQVDGKATLVNVPTYEQLEQTFASLSAYSSNLNALDETLPGNESSLENLLADSANLYSLSAYVSSEKEMNIDYEHSLYRENLVAAKAFAKTYDTSNTSGLFGETLTGEEQAVIDSILHVNLPVGVDYIKGGEEPLFKDNTHIQSIETNSVREIPDNEFKGCTALTSFTMNHNANGEEYNETMGLHAFEGNTALSSVTLPATLSRISREINPASGAEDGAALPFYGCESLKHVNFGDSPYYTCNDAIIYKLDDTLNPSTIVEVLQTRGKAGAGRSNVVLQNVSDIYPEAFKDCKEISSVDLQNTTIPSVPAGCFAGAENLSTAKLPETVSYITKDAFDNTNVGELYVNGDDTTLYWIDNMNDKNVVVYGHIGSSAHKFVQSEEARDPETKYEFAELPTITYTIYYNDCDPTLDYTNQSNWRALPTETVAKGQPSTGYETYTDYLTKWPGYKFSRWDQQDALQNGVNHDIHTVAIYEKSQTYTGEGKSMVTLRDADYDPVAGVGYEYHKTVDTGSTFGMSDLPTLVPREGYKPYFDPDLSSPLTIDDDTLILIRYYPDPDYVEPTDPVVEPDPVYHKVTFMVDDQIFSSQYVKHGEYPAEETTVPVKSGYEFVYWTPTSYTKQAVTEDMVIKANFERTTSSGVDGDGASSEGGSTSGSGSSGPSKSKSSSSKTSSAKGPFTITFVDYDGSVLSTQIIPKGEKAGKFPYVPTRKGYKFVSWSPSNYDSIEMTADLIVKATYQKDPNYVAPKSSTVSGNGTAKGKVVPNSKTKIDVSKTGISNKNLAAATVDGSNDNFVVKVTDSDEARSKMEQAFLNAYGSLDNLKYFAMDISLYDSTGTTKIINTNGLSVNVTIPIPDAMAGFAGNNKIATVDSSGNLERVNARLITIDNVPCVSFVAPHFSPYAVYVETNNLQANAGIADASPKTGDPIHPKWFLAIGLAIASILMFALRPSKKIVKVIA